MNWRGIGADLAQAMAGEGGSVAPAAPIQDPLKGVLFELAHRLPGPPYRATPEPGKWRGIGAELARRAWRGGVAALRSG
jgi:hypothetical protein